MAISTGLTIPTWKPIFDEHGDTRKASGSSGGYLLRNADDLHELVILLRWDSLDKARRFAPSEDLRKAMERAGVADQPTIFFLDEVDRPSA